MGRSNLVLSHASVKNREHRPVEAQETAPLGCRCCLSWPAIEDPLEKRREPRACCANELILQLCGANLAAEVGRFGKCFQVDGGQQQDADN